MILLSELLTYTNKLLSVKQFRDYCPNGMQIEGRKEVRRIVSGVTACLELIESAIEKDADLILVHHGYFWKGEPEAIVGMKARRIRRLLEADVSLLAYHLPLDAHPELGNNAQLARLLKLQTQGVLDTERSKPIVFWGDLDSPMSGSAFNDRISEALQRQPMWINAGERLIKRVGWCTGAAQDEISYAVTAQLDAFISGEISERTTHIAREEGLHYFSAGHHATERYGVQALGEHLSKQFNLHHQFIDIDNPA